MRLNNTICKNTLVDPQARAPKKLSDGKGLYLWVYVDGAKRWRYHYSLHGNKRLVSLGIYPEISLKDAREKAFEARKLVAEGIDPAIEKKKAKLALYESFQNTFEIVAERWLEANQSKWKPKYARDIVRRLELDIFPHLGKIPIKEITPPLLLKTIRKIEERGANDLAKRQLQKCGEIFRYAISEGVTEYGPSAHIKEALKPSKKGHFASIAVEEIPVFLGAVEQGQPRLHPTTYHALKLMMLTFVRTSELIKARWEEINFIEKAWIIPAERMKMGREHFVPLSEQAVAVLRDQHELTNRRDLVFASSIRPRQSISNNTILGALDRLGYGGRMTGHGFRSLAMSAIMQELGYRYEVPDLQLSHMKADKIRQAYDRAQFKSERIQMMQDWADYLVQHGLRV